MPNKDLQNLTDRLPLPPRVSDRIAKSRKKRKPKRGRSFLHIGFLLLMLGVIGFSVYQVARHVTVGINTLRTQEILDEAYVELELFTFRDEQLLFAEGSDTYLHTVPNGGRVGVGQPLGTAYAVGDAALSAELQQKLNAFGEHIELLRSLGGLGTPGDARDAAEAVDRDYLRLLEAAAKGDLSAVEGYRNGMQDSIGRYGVLTGALGSQSVAALEQARAALMEGMSPLAHLTADRSRGRTMFAPTN